MANGANDPLMHLYRELMTHGLALEESQHLVRELLFRASALETQLAAITSALIWSEQQRRAAFNRALAAEQHAERVERDHRAVTTMAAIRDLYLWVRDDNPSNETILERLAAMMVRGDREVLTERP